MPVIYTFPTKATLVPGDLVLISDSADDNKTKNATIASIKDAIDVVDSVIAGTGISVSSATGNVTISTPAYSGGGNIGHVPAGGTSNNFLRGDGTWNTATIPTASASSIGGIKLFSDITLPAVSATVNPAPTSKNYGVQTTSLDQAAVHVPWENTTDITLTTNGSSGDATWNGTTLNIPNYTSTSTTVQSITSSNKFSPTDTAYLSAIELTGAIGNVNLGVLNLNATNFGGTPPNPSSVDCRFLIKDNYWAQLWPAQINFLGGIRLSSATVQTVAPNTVSSTASKTYSVQLDSNDKAVVNVPWTDTDTDTTYSLGASSTISNDIMVSLDASGSATDSGFAIISSDSSISLAMSGGKVDVTTSATGGVSSFTNTNGTFISAGTANSAATGAVTMGTIDLSATGTKDTTTFLRGDNTWSVPPIPIEGFNTFSIYSASFEIANVSPAGGRTIIRQSVCETECTIGFVDFMRLTGKDPISVFIYSGTISSPSSAGLKLSGSQAAPLAAPTANSINTIQFKDASLNPQTYKFSAGESIVIVVSLAPGTVSAGGVSIAGGKLLSNQYVSRQNSQFMIPDGFDNPNPPANDLENFLEGTQAEEPTPEGVALHFYNLP